MSPPVLSQRQLNRAFLARQLLLERAKLTCEQAIEHLVGMQAQAPTAPYVGLWSRLDGFRFEDLSSLYDSHRVTRLAMMRSTIHLVTAGDAHRLRPLLEPVMVRGFKSSPWAKRLRGLDLDPVIAAGRSAVEDSPLTFAELGTVLGKRWPTYDGQALAQAIRAHVALVQVPPRGIWGRGGQARHTSLEAWLGRSPVGGSIDDLILRYLAGFGPASVNDTQTWSGMTRLRDDFVRLSPRLVRFRDENDVELFDLPDSPRPPADTPAPVRFLAEFDNALLSHADRTRIIDREDR
ncbi:MAG: winged helix DNA-binding domain-containing protein, partial [Acidimicrobiales bacterium]